MILAAQCPVGESAILGPAGIPIAFLVGVLSFFTPCILPLVPGYLSYLSGVSGEEMEAQRQRRRVVGGAALFVLGFSIVFTTLGVGASSFGRHIPALTRIGGVVVIAMGLAFLSALFVRPLSAAAAGGGASGVLSRGALRVVGVAMRERTLVDAAPRRAGLGGALPLGAAFAIGWIPCVGPGLGVILTLAAQEGSALRGGVMLFAFSLGFGVWFVLGGLAFRRALSAFAAVRRRMALLTGIGGAFLLAIGVLLVTDRWNDLIAPLRRAARSFVAFC